MLHSDSSSVMRSFDDIYQSSQPMIPILFDYFLNSFLKENKKDTNLVLMDEKKIFTSDTSICHHLEFLKSSNDFKKMSLFCKINHDLSQQLSDTNKNLRGTMNAGNSIDYEIPHAVTKMIDDQNRSFLGSESPSKPDFWYVNKFIVKEEEPQTKKNQTNISPLFAYLMCYQINKEQNLFTHPFGQINRREKEELQYLIENKTPTQKHVDFVKTYIQNYIQKRLMENIINTHHILSSEHYFSEIQKELSKTSLIPAVLSTYKNIYAKSNILDWASNLYTQHQKGGHVILEEDIKNYILKEQENHIEKAKKINDQNTVLSPMDLVLAFSHHIDLSFEKIHTICMDMNETLGTLMSISKSVSPFLTTETLEKLNNIDNIEKNTEPTIELSSTEQWIEGKEQEQEEKQNSRQPADINLSMLGDLDPQTFSDHVQAFRKNETQSKKDHSSKI